VAIGNADDRASVIGLVLGPYEQARPGQLAGNCAGRRQSQPEPAGRVFLLHTVSNRVYPGVAGI
jgi:hypothetical protein